MVWEIENLLRVLGQKVEGKNKAGKLQQLLKVVFPTYDDAALRALAERDKSVPTAQSRIAKVIAEHPEMALGVEMAKELDPECAQDFRGGLAGDRERVMGKKHESESEAEEEKEENDGEEKEEAEEDGEKDEGGQVVPREAEKGESVVPMEERAAVAEATEQKADSSSSGSDSSGSSSSSVQSSDDEAAAKPKAKAKAKVKQGARGSKKFVTAPCLQAFLSNPEEQAICQDFRENRFKAFDPRAIPDGVTDDDLRQETFSRTYGAKRAPRDALQTVMDWLWRKEMAASAETAVRLLLPAEGEESPELREVLSAEVAKGYYKKPRTT